MGLQGGRTRWPNPPPAAQKEEGGGGVCRGGGLLPRRVFLGRGGSASEGRGLLRKGGRDLLWNGVGIFFGRGEVFSAKKKGPNHERVFAAWRSSGLETAW